MKILNCIIVNKKGRFVTDEQKQIAKTYPKVKVAYQNLIKSGHNLNETVLPVTVSENEKVLLLFAQEGYGKNNSSVSEQTLTTMTKKIEKRYPNWKIVLK